MRLLSLLALALALALALMIPVNASADLIWATDFAPTGFDLAPDQSVVRTSEIVLEGLFSRMSGTALGGRGRTRQLTDHAEDRPARRRAEPLQRNHRDPLRARESRQQQPRSVRHRGKAVASGTYFARLSLRGQNGPVAGTTKLSLMK